MSLEEIEAAIECLPPEELDRFREWFANFDADEWDRQMAQDSREGKLDDLIEQAREHKRQGRCTVPAGFIVPSRDSGGRI